MPVRPIVFAIDNRYVRPLAVALASLEAQASGLRPVIVAYQHLHAVHRWLLIRTFRGSRLQLHFLRLQLPPMRWQATHHFSQAVLLRLLLARSIEAPSFVYADADMMFCGDPAALDRIPLGDAPMAAVPWPHARDLRANGHGLVMPYFASDLLVIDRERFLAERIGDRSLELISRHEFAFPDQDALNLCNANWQELPRSLSQSCTGLGPPLTEPPAGVLLMQFAGSEKPWHPFNRHPARRLVRCWLQRTPYRFFPPGWSDLRWRSLASRLLQRVLRFSRFTRS
jgi:lipopolysaccharide biosynthesis glycosyltransferase